MLGIRIFAASDDLQKVLFGAQMLTEFGKKDQPLDSESEDPGVTEDEVIEDGVTDEEAIYEDEIADDIF
jgi:hypothetical protein